MTKELAQSPGPMAEMRRWFGEILPRHKRESDVVKPKMSEVVEPADTTRVLNPLQEGVDVRNASSPSPKPDMLSPVVTRKETTEIEPGSKNPPRQERTTPFDLEQERLKRTITGIREFGTFSDEEKDRYARYYLDLLKRRSNRQHFVGIPNASDELRRQLEEQGVHALAGINALGNAVGFTIIRDAQPGQSDNWIEKIVIDNTLQNRRGRRTLAEKVVGQSSEPYHVGHDFLEKIVEWAFTTKMHDGREREALHTAIVMFVPNYERVDALFTHFFGQDERGRSKGGFNPVMRLNEQANVQLSDGRLVKRPISRFALYRQQWELEQRVRQSFQKTT